MVHVHGTKELVGSHSAEVVASDGGVRVHREEQAHVEHALHLWNPQQVLHVLHEFVLEFIARLLVAAVYVSLLRQHWHVVAAFLKAEAGELDDQV